MVMTTLECQARIAEEPKGEPWLSADARHPCSQGSRQGAEVRGAQEHHLLAAEAAGDR